MITKEQAFKSTEFHAGTCRRKVGPKGGVTLEIRTWRKNGAVKTWKTRPDDFEVPIKFGLYGFGAIFLSEGAGPLRIGNAHLFHAAEECPLLALDADSCGCINHTHDHGKTPCARKVVSGTAHPYGDVRACVECWAAFAGSCIHEWQEQPGEPPVDTCSLCGKVRS